MIKGVDSGVKGVGSRSFRHRAVEPSSGSNVIPRRARPGLAGLRPFTPTPPQQVRMFTEERLQQYTDHTALSHSLTLSRPLFNTLFHYLTLSLVHPL